MTKVYTQQEIWDYLCDNPLEVAVHIGALEDMNNQDYIFFDYITDNMISADDEGIFTTTCQFTVCTKDFQDRKTLVDYIKDEFYGTWNYDKADEHEYYMGRMRTDLLING